MPSGSTVVITYDGTDITQYVLWPSARFESQLNAVPGTFSFTVKDANHTFNFITGKELLLTVDGSSLFGGYVVQVERSYPFDAMDTTGNTDDVTRYFNVRGVDYNILFDKRFMRNTANYLSQIPNFPNTAMDGALVTQLWTDYLDTPSGFDVSTFVDDIQPPFEFDSATGAWNQQGTAARRQMQDFAQFTGAVWYFDADKNLHWHAIEDTLQRWGFSDVPNKNAITASPATYQSATIGMREVRATQKGDHKVHDALIWGGSQWAGSGGTVFARETVSPGTGQISYQYSETHFGELGFGIQAGVDARANLIVNGSPGAVGADQQRGLRYDQWNFRFTWFAHQVPKLSGTPNHIRPGYLSTITLEVFDDGGPLVQVLPLRSVTVSFPQLDPDGNGYVKFEGFFGLQPDDPFTLWRFLLNLKNKRPTPVVAVAVDGSQSTIYGAFGSFTPTPTPNGAATIFTIPFGYIPNTTIVYLFPAVGGGQLLRRGVDYTESNSTAGEITLATPPVTGEVLRVDCRTLAS